MASDHPRFHVPIVVGQEPLLIRFPVILVLQDVEKALLYHSVHTGVQQRGGWRLGPG